MRPIALLILVAAAAVMGCTGPAPATPPGQPGSNEGHPAPAERLKDLDALVAAYPDLLARHDDTTLVWKDGTRMPISDGRENKTAAELIEDPDIDDIFAWPYPLGAKDDPPPTDFDPGRARPDSLFGKMYGDCRKGEVAAKLAKVPWAGGSIVKFTTVNGANEQLELVARELEALGPHFAPYLSPVGGTFNCREIAGTERLSMHAFAAAIDLNTAYGDYWRWSGGEQKTRPYRNRIPLEIVRVFEKHGFIWGGRWAHFDTFHFEYRPELILAATRAQEAPR
jgi:hypothetical protein